MRHLWHLHMFRSATPMANTETSTRVCSKCQGCFPLTAEYFGHTSSGGFRSYCRKCKNKQTSEWAELNKWNDKKKWTKQNTARANAKGSYSARDVDLIRRFLGDRCAYCGVSLYGGGEIDHMIPLDKGGSHAPSNLTIACMPCNRAKGNRTPKEYLEYRLSHALPVRRWNRGKAPW